MSHSEDLESLKNELSTPEHLKDFDVSMKKYLESKNADLLSITIAIVARDKNECTNALFIASGPRSNNSDNLSSCFPLMCMVSPRPEDEEETILQEVHKQVSILPGKRVTNIAKVLGGSNDDDIETRRMMYEGEDIPVEFKRVVYLTFVVDIDPDCGFDENGLPNLALGSTECSFRSDSPWIWVKQEEVVKGMAVRQSQTFYTAFARIPREHLQQIWD